MLWQVMCHTFRQGHREQEEPGWLRLNLSPHWKLLLKGNTHQNREGNGAVWLTDLVKKMGYPGDLQSKKRSDKLIGK